MLLEPVTRESLAVHHDGGSSSIDPNGYTDNTKSSSNRLNSDEEGLLTSVKQTSQ